MGTLDKIIAISVCGLASILAQPDYPVIASFILIFGVKLMSEVFVKLNERKIK